MRKEKHLQLLFCLLFLLRLEKRHKDWKQTDNTGNRKHPPTRSDGGFTERQKAFMGTLTRGQTRSKLYSPRWSPGGVPVYCHGSNIQMYISGLILAVNTCHAASIAVCFGLSDWITVLPQWWIHRYIQNCVSLSANILFPA